MSRLVKSLYQNRTASSLVLAAVVVLATWMGAASRGYFTGSWAPVALIVAILIFLASVAGLLRKLLLEGVCALLGVENIFGEFGDDCGGYVLCKQSNTLGSGRDEGFLRYVVGPLTPRDLR